MLCLQIDTKIIPRSTQNSPKTPKVALPSKCDFGIDFGTQAKDDWTDWSAKVGLDYQLSDNTLAYLLYLWISTSTQVYLFS